MNKKWILGAALAATLVIPAAARAHTGHAHKVSGIVTQRHDKNVEIRTQEGKLVVVTLNDKTTFENGTKKVTPMALEVGHRVVVDVGDGKEPMVARGVKIGVKEAKK